jgi:hypothetical protein
MCHGRIVILPDTVPKETRDVSERKTIPLDEISEICIPLLIAKGILYYSVFF